MRDVDYLRDHAGRRSPAQLARALGRSVKGVQHMRYRYAAAPTLAGEYVTAQQCAHLIGRSPQWVASLCRAGRIPAHRNPGGHWWLISLADLPAIAARYGTVPYAPPLPAPSVRPAPQPPPVTVTLTPERWRWPGRIA